VRAVVADFFLDRKSKGSKIMETKMSMAFIVCKKEMRNVYEILVAKCEA
jgi:hypothetical protein